MPSSIEDGDVDVRSVLAESGSPSHRHGRTPSKAAHLTLAEDAQEILGRAAEVRR
jgi:hypothetical protein